MKYKRLWKRFSSNMVVLLENPNVMYLPNMVHDRNPKPQRPGGPTCGPDPTRADRPVNDCRTRCVRSDEDEDRGRRALLRDPTGWSLRSMAEIYSASLKKYPNLGCTGGGEQSPSLKEAQTRTWPGSPSMELNTGHSYC